MAGHSKWTQIKHKKAVIDAKKGTLFSKLVREVLMAARSGGGDPATNSRLRGALERARSGGLPKDNIERAIARATGGAEGIHLKEFLYEAAAPGGISILIKGITDNTNRTHNELRRLLADHGSRMADPGSLIWNFEQIGTIEIAAADNATKTKDEIALVIVDAGAYDFTETEVGWFVETMFADRDVVRKALEEHGITIRESGHYYKSRNTLALDDARKREVKFLLDALMGYDDVQEVYTNMS